MGKNNKRINYTWSIYAPDTITRGRSGEKREKKKKRNDTLSNKQYTHLGGLLEIYIVLTKRKFSVVLQSSKAMWKKQGRDRWSQLAMSMRMLIGDFVHYSQAQTGIQSENTV